MRAGKTDFWSRCSIYLLNVNRYRILSIYVAIVDKEVKTSLNMFMAESFYPPKSFMHTHIHNILYMHYAHYIALII